MAVDGVIPQTTLEKELKNTFFLIQASSFEKQCLWERFHTSVHWEMINQGLWETIGILDGRPVTLSVFWARINGQLIAFWDPTSQVVDHAMIERWFEEHTSIPKWDKGTRDARTNAENFDDCLAAISEANKR